MWDLMYQFLIIAYHFTFQMVDVVEYDQLVKYIRTWTCRSSVPQSTVRQCELQKQRLGLVALMKFLGRYFM